MTDEPQRVDAGEVLAYLKMKHPKVVGEAINAVAKANADVAAAVSPSPNRAQRRASTKDKS